MIALYVLAVIGGVILAALYVYFWIYTFTHLGQWWTILTRGVREIKRDDIKVRLQPVVERVYDKVIAKSPHIARDIKIKYSPDPTADVFAVGKKTICITQGLLSMGDDAMIEGLLAHEFGHLALGHNSSMKRRTAYAEYAADAYAFEIGYGYELAQAVDMLSTPEPAGGEPLYMLVRRLMPTADDRIGELQKLGVPYGRY